MKNPFTPHSRNFQARRQTLSRANTNSAAGSSQQQFLTPEQLAQQRYLYQGQGGYDVSQTMTAAPDLADTFAPSAPSVSSNPNDTQQQLGSSRTGIHRLNNSLSSFFELPDPSTGRSLRAYMRVIGTVLFATVLILSSLGIALAAVSSKPAVAGMVAIAHSQQIDAIGATYEFIGAEIQSYVTTLPFEQESEIRISSAQHNTVWTPGLNDDELSHLSDVQSVIGTILIMTFAVVPVLAIIITVMRNSQFVRHSLFGAGIVCMALSVVTALFVLLFFEPTFILFHQVFFPQGNYEFYEGTLLVTIFPQGFWVMSGLLWSIVFAANGAILTGLSRFCGKYTLSA